MRRFKILSCVLVRKFWDGFLLTWTLEQFRDNGLHVAFLLHPAAIVLIFLHPFTGPRFLESNRFVFAVELPPIFRP